MDTTALAPAQTFLDTHGPAKTKALLARLADKIEVVGDHWAWTAGSRGERGFVALWFDGRNHLAHRVVYELLLGPVPDDMLLAHVAECGESACVNPDHLELIDPATKCRRTAADHAATHCATGHEFTPENTYRCPGARPFRRCRTCRRETARARRQAAA